MAFVVLIGITGILDRQKGLNRGANKACLGCKGDLFGVRLRLVWSGKMMLFGQNWAQFGGLLGQFGGVTAIFWLFNLYFVGFRGSDFSGFNVR